MRRNARALRASLRDVVLGDDARAATAALRLAEDGLWPTAVVLSGQWRVTPIVRERLARLGVAVDAASAVRMREMAMAAIAHRALALKRSGEALAALDRAGVEAVAIKGVALVASLYGPRSARMVGDLDIIIREGAYPAARAALEAEGYVDRYIAVERHLADIKMSPHLHNLARNLTSADFEVDVHWRLGWKPAPPLRTDRMIERARTAAVNGAAIRVAAPADAMAIAAHHALRGYFSPFEVMKDAYDLAAWWTLKRDAWQLSDVIETADAAEVATALYALWRLIDRCDSGHPVAEGVAALRARLTPRLQREAEQLADFCNEQFECGARAERTVQLFDGGRLWRAFVGNGRKMVGGVPAGQAAPEAVAGSRVPRKPLPARISHAARRVVRVVRELASVRSWGEYSAVARAQGRHH